MNERKRKNRRCPKNKVALLSSLIFIAIFVCVCVMFTHPKRLFIIEWSSSLWNNSESWPDVVIVVVVMQPIFATVVVRVLHDYHTMICTCPFFSSLKFEKMLTTPVCIVWIQHHKLKHLNNNKTYRWSSRVLMVMWLM